VVRQLARGGEVTRFEVTLPSGLSWSKYRSDISKLEFVKGDNISTIQLNNPGHAWLSQYQGNMSSITTLRFSITNGSSQITMTTASRPALTTGQFYFKAGDFIQLGTGGKVYTVAADVPDTASFVQLHRPVLEATSSNVLSRIGPNCIWSVVNTEFPTWTLFARDQVSFNGPFVFYELL
jgi:hypothetical protein